MKAKHNLEHVVFNSWMKNPRHDSFEKIIVAVSGGSDSMAMLQALMNCFPKQKLVVVHIHHGSGQNQSFRDQARKLVEQFCRVHSLECIVKKSEKNLSSESEFRQFRLQSFQQVTSAYSSSVVCQAHHRDDWLETQLIKLIRGSGLSSLKKSFNWSRLVNHNLLVWRPFYARSQKELTEYRQENDVPFVDDPSNWDTQYFRNWLRLEWLPSLEKTRPGSMRRLALSLLHSLAEIEPVETSFPWDLKQNSIDLIYFLSLSEAEKLRCLAYFIREKGLKSIKASQLKEIVRQLDKRNDRYHIHFKTFECVVNAEQVIIKVL